MVRDRASSWLLELAGYSPNPAAGNHRGDGPRAGWTIDLSEPTQPGLVIVVNHPLPPAPRADQTGVVIDATPTQADRWSTGTAFAQSCAQEAPMPG